MEVILVLIVVGVWGYFHVKRHVPYEGFFRGNVYRGTETVRAFVYLSALARGRTPDEANRYANYDSVNGPTEVIEGAARFVQAHCNGKQLPLIAEARRLGMGKRSSVPTGRWPGIFWAGKGTGHEPLGTVSRMSTPSASPEAVPGGAHTGSYDDYRKAFVLAAKELDTEDVVDGSHWIEDADTDAIVRAGFAERMEPLRLAELTLLAARSDQNTPSFNAYRDACVAEVKRIDPRCVINGLHWVELVDEEGMHRAFTDGVSPQALAVMIVEHGPPPMGAVG